MSDLQIQFAAFVAVATVIAAFVSFRVAVAEPLIEANAAWGWAGAAGVAAVIDMGVLFEVLQLDQGAPAGGRIGAVVLGVLCAAGVGCVAYGLKGGSTRGGRWCATATAFTAAMAVLAVVFKIVA